MEDKRRKLFAKKIEIKVKDKGDDLAVKNNNRTKKVLDELSKKDTKIINPDGDTEKISLEQRPEPKLKCQMQTKYLGAHKEDIKLKVKETQDPARMLFNRRMLDLKRSREQHIARLKIQRVNRSQDTKRDEKGASPKVQENIAPATEQIKMTKDDNRIDKDKTQETILEVTKTSNTHNQKKINTVIKTVVTKDGDVKTFKEVAFVEPKKLTPLEIKIPTHVNEKVLRSSRGFDIKSMKSNQTLSKTSIDENIETAVANLKKKKNNDELKKKRRPPPMECLLTENDDCRSPMTETARWVPTSVNNHTKPYYEAWVDTKLAATTKYSPKTEKLWKGRETKTYISYLNRPSYPEIITNIDEKYTGRIKITQR